MRQILKIVRHPPDRTMKLPVHLVSQLSNQVQPFDEKLELFGMVGEGSGPEHRGQLPQPVISSVVNRPMNQLEHLANQVKQLLEMVIEPSDAKEAQPFDQQTIEELQHRGQLPQPVTASLMKHPLDQVKHLADQMKQMVQRLIEAPR
mmetsp:Transcript_26502/g.48756  ORF Transcript_26502/g.48756 Transcript_26502/m.48756 type:complete len:147 (+) Transcript_26502:2141-2581(+)